MSVPLWFIFISPTLLGILVGIFGEVPMPTPLLDKKGSLRKALEFVGTHLWSWWAIGPVVPLLLGAGVSAMYSTDYIVASVLFFAGTVLLGIKTGYAKETTSEQSKGAIRLLIVVVCTSLFAVLLLWEKHVYTLHSQEVKLTTPPLPTVEELARNIAKNLPRQHDTQVMLSEQAQVSDKVEMKVTRHKPTIAPSSDHPPCKTPFHPENFSHGNITEKRNYGVCIG